MLKILEFISKIISEFQKKEKERLENVVISSVTIKSIREKLIKQSENIQFLSSEYKDIKVRWHLSFKETIEFKRFGAVRIILAEETLSKESSQFPLKVYIEFKTNKFPELKIMEKGTKFYAIGIITKVDKGRVCLKPLKIEKDPFFVI